MQDKAGIMGDECHSITQASIGHGEPASKTQQALEAFDKIKQALSERQRE